jgi:aspartyl-tRNA(Asn)/glutamyl-tRNA(Gln) amidotransferase subunit C
MSLSTEQVKKIASLARIKVSNSEVEKYQNELNKIFKLIEELNQANTDGVEPLLSVCEHELMLREDVETHENLKEPVLKNAPSKHGFFVVPKVVE